jgi:heat shock protein HslJ
VALALAAVIIVAACGGKAELSNPSASVAPTMSEIAGATVDGILDHEITLAGGLWQGEPVAPGSSSRPSVGLIEHFALDGDLDGDGRPESAVLLWESSGGSGTRLYLAVMARTDDGVRDAATVFVGDRVQVRSGHISDRKIVLDVVRHGPTDPACCPTERAVIRFAFDGATLTQTADEVTGLLSSADLEGEEWRLLVMGWNLPVPDNSTITLTVEGDRVAGSSGCNSYFGGITDLEPGRISIGEVGSTMMACPEAAMVLEQRFLGAVANASSYSFLAGRLALTCDTEDGSTTLIFEASADTE